MLLAALVGAAAWSAFGPREGLQMAISQQPSITTAAQGHQADIIDDIIDLIDGIMGGNGSGASGGSGAGSAGGKP